MKDKLTETTSVIFTSSCLYISNNKQKELALFVGINQTDKLSKSKEKIIEKLEKCTHRKNLFLECFVIRNCKTSLNVRVHKCVCV